MEPLGPRAIFITIRRLREEALNWHVHPHTLRHGCGYKLAADETDTRAIAAHLGHRRLENTAIYTALAPGRFKDFWKD